MQHSISGEKTNTLPITKDAAGSDGNSALPQILSGGWRASLQQILPLYLSLHLTFLLLTYFAALFNINNNVYYLGISLPLLAFWLLQWLTGGWIV